MRHNLMGNVTCWKFHLKKKPKLIFNERRFIDVREKYEENRPLKVYFEEEFQEQKEV